MKEMTKDNLKASFAGESQAHVKYLAFSAQAAKAGKPNIARLEVAGLQNEKGARRSMTYAIEAEKIHIEMYKDAKKAAEAGEDADISEIYICPVCGFTHIGEPPDRCPVCNAKKEKFRVF
jgi:rubrerythrin